ncbi:tripartite motif-containing protein 16-like [Sphaeramia orbicularis]|uniref:tripartite motif-containing protein 16-like n=1 Tax=Sphaeramia orbicularis TaxID=375764 RepID=UPI00117D8C4A|nr:tripartite motif-containing protein 16-like [Sphaeramia orbicularis]
MAQNRQKLTCSVCLDLFKDPVTIPCGHSYCMSCIKGFWEHEDQKTTHSCPQCRHSVTPRPALVKNTILAEIVEDLKRVGPEAASPDLCYAEPKDVACDFCTGRKLKAFKSCLMCMASYCEEHLQPHYDVAPLRKHKLLDATLNLQGTICSRHDEVMKIFCRTDHQCICYLCLMDEHKGHMTVSAAAELAERQTELSSGRQKLQLSIQEREERVKAIQQEVEAINHSADDAVRESEKIFSNLIRFIKKKSTDAKQQIRSQQKTQVSRAKEHQDKIQQELNELKSKDAVLEQVSHSEDHIYFLNNYPSLPCLSESADLPNIKIHPPLHFEYVKAAVSEAADKVKAVLSEEWLKVSLSVINVDVLLPKKEPQTRPEILKYFRSITLDPNTTNVRVLLSEGNRKTTLIGSNLFYPNHPDRFVHWQQVLGRDGLTGRCYWEVEYKGLINIGVAYKDIRRQGTREECGLGCNEKSWALECNTGCYTFVHDNISTPVSGPHSSRVGIYLDHTAGTLSFYSVCKTMTLLHRVQTKFTQAVYAGLWLRRCEGDTAEMCDLK